MEILLPIILLSAIALIGGIVLVVFSAKFAVKEDETAAKIAEVLPGANCGGCGYSGCKAYAAAIASGEAPAHKCNPGGAAVIAKIRDITGMRIMEPTPKTAVVMCAGSNDVVETKMNYRGVQSCAAAAGYFAGTSACTHGCIGLGDCVKACAYEAITVKDDLAHVDQSKCTGCSSCVKACPKGIIRLVDTDRTHIVLCSNHDKPAYTAKICKAGCIGCGKCTKVCESGAVTLDNNLAVIDRKLCIGCGKCVEVCPRGIIRVRGN